MNRRFFTFLAGLLMLPMLLFAQQKPTERERASWMKEMQQYKIEYLAKKLELTGDQKVKFANLYKCMDDEVRRVNEQAMKLDRVVRKKGDQATDLEREKAAEAQFELKGKEGAIEMRYFNDFKAILDSRQLLMLKKAERDFSKELMTKQRERRKK